MLPCLAQGASLRGKLIIYRSQDATGCFRSMGLLTCFECSFVSNSANGQSGVLGLISGLTTSVVGCNFTANTSPDGIGSGVFAVSQTSSFTVANSTFVDNGGARFDHPQAEGLPSGLGRV